MATDPNPTSPPGSVELDRRLTRLEDDPRWLSVSRSLGKLQERVHRLEDIVRTYEHGGAPR